MKLFAQGYQDSSWQSWDQTQGSWLPAPHSFLSTTWLGKEREENLGCPEEKGGPMKKLDQEESDRRAGMEEGGAC